MNILFTVSHYKTLFFKKIADNLTNVGHNVFWISPGKLWARWLMRQGVDKENILVVADYVKEWSNNNQLSDIDLHMLFDLEKFNKWSIKDLIMMDRLLKLKPYHYALKYLSVCQHQISSFFKSKEIEIVFQEVTWAIELLITQICNKNGIKVFSIDSVRIPYDRFAFFEGHLAKGFITDNKIKNEYVTLAESIYRDICNKSKKPDYFVFNNKVPKLKLKFFIRFFWHLINIRYNIGDETCPSIFHLIKERINSIVRYKWVKKYISSYNSDAYRDKPYVLFPLHVQPEASIDVRGSYYSNQLELIKILARSIPVTHNLLVKEHPNFIGTKRISFYKECVKIPGVYLVNPYEDSISLIKSADLVISVTGTACLEAGILGVKSLLLGEAFFSNLTFCNKVEIFSEKFNGIYKVLTTQMPSDKERRKRAINGISRIIANSYPGIVGDVRSDSRCKLPDNIKNVVAGFCHFISQVVPKL
jgi:hypothetical protein